MNPEVRRLIGEKLRSSNPIFIEQVADLLLAAAADGGVPDSWIVQMLGGGLTPAEVHMHCLDMSRLRTQARAGRRHWMPEKAPLPVAPLQHEHAYRS